MEKLFLLDAYALIYRAYYAFIKNPRINSKGFNTSAILGFVNTLEEVLRKENPTHIGIAFDPSGPTFRHEAYEAYKAQREETPEAIRQSVPVIKDIIRAYHIPILEIAGYEADDVIGTLATEAGKRGINTYMMTPDKDYGQLVSEHVFMYRPKYGDKDFEVMGVEEVKAKFDIQSPLQVIDMLGLMGDTADNIPGCPGVGEKTAQKLIAQFGSIENLLAHTDELKGAIKKKVEENKEQITFSKFLATIKTDVPIALDMEALKREEPDEEELRRLFEMLEFRSLIDRVIKTEKKAPSSPAAQPDLFGFFAEEDTADAKNSILTRLEDLPYDYQLVDNKEKMAVLAEKLLVQKFFSLDTETTGIDPITAELVGMSFSFAENQAFYVPVPANREEALTIVNIFKPAFENPDSLKIGQNIKYDLIMLANYGVTLKGKMFDTMIAHYVLQPELRHGMDYLAEIYLKYETIKIEELIGAKGKKQGNMRDLAPEAVYKYACEDADVTLKLKQVLGNELETNGVKKLFEEIEMPLVPVLAYMERNGVRIDTEALKETSRHFTARMNQIEEEVHQLAGMEFNIASPKQVGEVLFDRLKIVEKAKKTKTGYSTAADVLDKLAPDYPLVAKILEYRQLAKLKSTYADGLANYIGPDGRIHGKFHQTVTATGRISSTEPNLQNIPVRVELGRLIRKVFIPEDGYVFVDADYSQIELRVLAHCSGDQQLIQAYREAKDIHRITASQVFHVPFEEVTPLQRRNAKAVNFGIVYGISSFGLSQDLSITRKEAAQYIEDYFRTYPGIKRFLDDAVAHAKEKGYVVTLFGRRRPVPELSSSNYMQRSFGERVAMNAPIQGTAADIIKIAMIGVGRRLKEQNMRSRLVLQVHDELLIEAHRPELEEVEKILKEEMEQAASLDVPLEIDMHTGENWYEAK